MTSEGNLTVLHTGRQDEIKSVVEALEAALEEARDGRIIALGIAVVRPGCVTINTRVSEGAVAGPLLGAVTLLQHRLLVSIEKQ